MGIGNREEAAAAASQSSSSTGPLTLLLMMVAFFTPLAGMVQPDRVAKVHDYYAHKLQVRFKDRFKLQYWFAIHQFLRIILSLRIPVLLPVSTLPYLVKVTNCA
jgi:hypothetical protein